MSKCSLYSVYPAAIRTPLCQLGSYVIPAADDPDHQSPIPGCSVLVIPDVIVPDYKGKMSATGVATYENMKVEGHEVIDGSILIHYPGRGIFRLGEDETVLTQAHVDKAKEELKAFLLAAYNSADRRWEQTHNRMDIGDVGRLAAKYFGQKPEWVTDTNVAREVPCPVCKEKIKQDALKCRHCQTILDQGAFNAATKQQAAPVTEPEPPRVAAAGGLRR